MWSLIKFKNCQKVIFPTKMLRPGVHEKVNVAGTDITCAVVRESGKKRYIILTKVISYFQ